MTSTTECYLTSQISEMINSWFGCLRVCFCLFLPAAQINDSQRVSLNEGSLGNFQVAPRLFYFVNLLKYL